jgi:hypothetical protein
VVDLAVVVGLLPPGELVSEVRITRSKTVYHYRERIGSSIRPVPDMCIRRRMISNHSSPVRRIVRMLDFELRLHWPRWRG